MDAVAAQILVSRLRADPAFFCREVLGVELWRKQRATLEALRDHDRVAVRSGHGTGKSFTAACAALWFLYSHVPAKVITTAPTQTQVRHILWTELRRLHEAARVPLGGKLFEDRVRVADDAFALGLSTDEAERFQGFHSEHLLVILDEAPGVRPDVWRAAETLLTGRVGKMLAIGNPTRADGLFHACFKPGSGWVNLAISCLESPNLAVEDDAEPPFPRLVTRRWIEARRRDWGEDGALWRSRVLGEFPAGDQDRWIPADWLEAAVQRAALPGSPAPEPAGLLRLGVDVARQGSDETVLLLRDDRAVRKVGAFSGQSTMATAGRVKHWVDEEKVAAEYVFIDDTGLGAGVTDRLRELGLDVRAVVAAERADDAKRFANRRAENAWRMRAWLSPEGGGSVPATEAQLLKELAALRLSYASNGALRLGAKDDVRAALSRSPDRADALALTFSGAAREPAVTIF